MFVRKFALPSLAVAGLAVATYVVFSSNQQLAAAPPIADPAGSPFRSQIAGAGIVEAASQNLAIGTPLAGIVVDVPITQGQVVQRGDVLFRLDDRDRRATLAVRKAEIDAAREDLAKLEALPRPEDVPPAKARVDTARTELERAERQLELAQSVTDKRAVSVEELDRRRFAVEGARSQLATVDAELARLLAGAWAPDLAAARTRLQVAEVSAEQVETELERLVVRAPIDGSVLQINVRLGEYAEAGARTPLVLLGDLSKLHVRIDIDESDAWRFAPGAPATAYVRGNNELSTKLEFVRVDPYVVPKRSLTGDSLERIDTRVLQVIYGFDTSALPVYPGQQMDVFIEAKPHAEAAR